jgi:hypothetical protein
MQDGSSDGNDGPPSGPSEPRAAQGAAGESLSAADYLRLAEECFLVASFTKDDPEKAAELVKAGDDYLHLAAKWLADQLKID